MVREKIRGQVMKCIVYHAEKFGFYCTGNGEPSRMLNNGIIRSDMLSEHYFPRLDWPSKDYSATFYPTQHLL